MQIRPAADFNNPGFTQDDGHPVVCVNWHDAKAYTTWLSQKTKFPYRLPSEIEREYVTRAGSASAFWWGDSISSDQANYDGEHAYGKSKKGVFRQKTVSANSFRANPFGLFNVHGNVTEWTEDCYQVYPISEASQSQSQCSDRVYRGGNWLDEPGLVRAASRRRNQPNFRPPRCPEWVRPVLPA